MIQTTKRAFTLFEIMIAVFILTLIGSVTAWQTHRMIAAHEFEKEVTDFCIGLQEAQVIAVTHQTYLEAKLAKHKGKTLYQITSDEPLKVLDRKEKKCKQTDHFTFNGKPFSSMTFTIFSNGRIEPLGVIGFHKQSSEEEKQSLWIDLQSPLHIGLSHKKPSLFTASTPIWVEPKKQFSQ